jgi:protein-tyrosine sulfotransferase
MTASSEPALSPEPALSSPVFIVTAARSGSTLLRFILDSHPDLACPPESDIGIACASLARSWTVIGKATAGRGGQAEPAGLTDEALAALREAADAVLGCYLEGTGKRRVCDKSLSTVYFAGLLAQVYPEARFICLYRHCMDVIASYIAAMPWGLGGIAGEPTFLPMHGHVSRNPGDSVAAVAEYWLDCARRSAEFESSHPGRCYRLRYEDLVADPEETAAAVLAFLGLAPAPGITRACFRVPHDRGPSDPKIWATSRVQSDSVGTGAVVPAARLPAAARPAINDMLAALGYRVVTDGWNTGGRRDPREEPGRRIPA